MTIYRSLHYCNAQGMLAGALQAGGDAEDFVAFGDRLRPKILEFGFAFGECSGFVDNKGVDFFQNLESLCILDGSIMAFTDILTPLAQRTGKDRIGSLIHYACAAGAAFNSMFDR